MKAGSLILGRFQPITIAHYRIIQDMKQPSVVCIVRGSKTDKSPIPLDMIMTLIKDAFNGNIRMMHAKTGYVPDIIQDVENGFGFSIDTVYAGSDRVKGYQGQLKRAGLDSVVSVVEIPRTDEDVSASKVRAAIKNRDRAAFESLTPRGIHSWYRRLLEVISEN